jgi:hypothetical protein
MTDPRSINGRGGRRSGGAGWLSVAGGGRGSSDNLGGFQLLNPITNGIVGGVRFDMSAQDVVDYCTEE